MACLRDGAQRPVRVSAERLRQILHAHDITFQRTKTCKETNDPDRGTKLARIEEVLDRHPQRCFAFDEFGPLREFVLNNSNHPNHTVLTRRLHAHLRWRNANARDPAVLAAQRRERARVRAQRGRRWDLPTTQAA